MTRTFLFSLAIVGLVACDTEIPADDGVDLGMRAPDEAERAAPPMMSYAHVYQTCGDVVCSGWQFKDLPPCPAWAQPGMACPAWAIGQMCDPGDFCNTEYVCEVEDPTGGGNCPISKRDAKRDIAYLDGAATEKLANDLLSTRLATYRYRTEGEQGPEHLGFIIDDVVPSPAVQANGERVDLYAYTSMAVAALQVQQKRIEALEAELAALREAKTP